MYFQGVNRRGGGTYMIENGGVKYKVQTVKRKPVRRSLSSHRRR